MVQILTGAKSHISAAHNGPRGIHGHTYEVLAWWSGGDAIDRQNTLADWCASFDHQLLPDDLASGELLAKRCFDDLGCFEVVISRPIEGLFAAVRAGG